MKLPILAVATLLFAGASLADSTSAPRFSTNYFDRTIDLKSDFYHFACGSWIKNNPTPADKSRWSGFEELQEHNWRGIHEILDQSASTPAASGTPARQVGDFYASAMDTNRIERLGFKPIRPELRRVAAVRDGKGLIETVAWLHGRGVGAFFGGGVAPDEKNSSIYALQFGQGGLSLPDRDYYLSTNFSKQRLAYGEHVAKMFRLLGETEGDARADADTVVSVETDLAKASKTRVELRDPEANYNKLAVAGLLKQHANLHWDAYFDASEVAPPQTIIIGQTNFFAALNGLLAARPLADLKTYVRWHVLHAAAPHLHQVVRDENFEFFGKTLRGQPAEEPRWQRAAKVIDGSIGEALGGLYVKRYFPASARERMNDLVNNVRAVFKDRIQKAEWMSEGTRKQALAKFERFTQKIGHPDKFRDYSKIRIRPDDYLGNIRRSALFETRREFARIGKPVDKTEWGMTPQTVNAYFNPVANEIVFPAGILQPPFFDAESDDAVNYGAIGVVIGHEITHGYDDQGRQYDAEGNLRDWWTKEDAAEFKRRAQKVVDQYSAYEALPGAKVNGELTLGENLADLGGTSIAYEALERALAKDPSKRKTIDGFTPEQRFFLSLSQLWRVNWREAELRRRLVVDPHSPAQFRGIGPHVNQPEFFQAFDIKPGDPVWRAPEDRAKIW
jgi:putative endopeptidase